MEMSVLVEKPMALLMSYAYMLPRLLAMFSMIPMLSRQALPGILRSGVVGGIGLMIVPTLFDPVQAVDRTAIEVLALVCKEVVLGLVLGIVLAIPLWAFEGMGAFIDAQRGASIAQIISPSTGHDSSPLGEFFNQAATTYLLASGGFLILLGVAYASYEMWPVFSLMPRFNDEAPSLLLQQLDRLMRLAVLLGAPVLIAMFLTEMGLALVSRFAPQLQVFFLAMPIKSGVALFILAIYAYALFDQGGLEMLGMEKALHTLREMLVTGAR